MKRVQLIEVAADDAGMRLDRWLRRRFPQLGQGRIEKMCRKGELRIDGGRVKAATRLDTGQMVRVPPLPEGPAPMVVPKTQDISPEDARMIREAVIWRDDDIIAINKPAGLPVQGGSGQRRHVDGLAEALKFGLDEKPRLVHRLDKDTSGILLLARNGRAARGLTRAFAARTTRKIYWAVVAGVPSPRMGTIRFGLVKAPGHGPHGAGERMICLHPDQVAGHDGARHATSDYAVLETAGRRASWVALVPVTGRTHQLRAHMAEIGHPIIGDGKYGTNRQTNEGDGWGAQLGGDVSRKLHLHARMLSFFHPVTGNRLTLVAPLPPHMRKTWELFAWDERDVPADPFDEAD